MIRCTRPARNRNTRLPALVLLAVAVAAPAAAQQTPYAPQALTEADYARAEGRLAQNARALVTGADVSPVWYDPGRFTYRNTTADGWEFVAVDPNRRTRSRAFDHGRLAEALGAVLGEDVEANRIPFSSVTMTREGLRGSLRGTTYRCDLDQWICRADENGVSRTTVVSPDGRKGAFIRDYDLWVRDLTTGEEKPLTTDGVENYGYATNDAGWTRSEIPVLLWSPDSRKIATFRHDGRGVSQMYLVSTDVGAPDLMQFNYPLPEDSLPFRIERNIIEVETGRVIPLRMPPDMHRSTICDHIWCNGVFSDVEWAADGSELFFVSSSRDHKEATLRVADAATGAVRDVLFEREETFFESGYDQVNWFVMEEANEVVWYSRRSDWGHLYLYDLATGELKRPLTQGAWNVLQVRHVDEDGRAIYFVGSGREPGDPYFEYFYRVGMDDGRITLLTPDSANHEISVAPSGEWFVDQWSTPVTAPRAVVRGMDGRERMELEKADISRLVESGWEAPIPFTVKARDGITDLYGLLYRPRNLDPSKKYPVINYLYPGPQTGSVGSRSFSPARRDHQALAELGFVVVEVDAMGTPKRSHSFHSAYYGDMGDNGLPDQVTAIEQLARRYPWMDLDRVGIWGHSGGGFASTAGILRYPDFYKVAVSQAGNHDNRNYEDDWGEKWQGLLETYPDGTTNYDNQANQLQAHNLEGKLLIAHGTADTNVPMSNTMLVVD
ncbi:MAG TPA: DPP IV N-terminal domain-containing protein, partial [Longimicrobiales bacterium]|nr:DPP IV N-terminal domain-containing protein [Longimicrobiales bacterium]